MADDIPADVQGFIHTANSAEALGDHTGRAAAATAALEAWKTAFRPAPSATPNDAAGAAQRLAHLEKDSAFRGRYLSGDSATVAEFNRLNDMAAQADPAALAVEGYAAPNGVDENSGAVADTHTMVAAAKDWDTLAFQRTRRNTSCAAGNIRKPSTS
jgi:hypothetical protein